MFRTVISAASMRGSKASSASTASRMSLVLPMYVTLSLTGVTADPPPHQSVHLAPAPAVKAIAALVTLARAMGRLTAGQPASTRRAPAEAYSALQYQNRRHRLPKLCRAQ